MRVCETGFVAALLLLLPACETDTGEGDQPGVHTVRVSERLDGTQANGDCNNPAVSGDGRFVAFESEADTLTDDDVNGFRDILVKDRTTGAIENITLVKDGSGLIGPISADCNRPSISADGRYVAFESTGFYLAIPPAFPARRTLWRYDRLTGEFRNVVDPGNPAAWPDQDLAFPSLSADGRFLAFTSDADNLVAGVTCGGVFQAWVADFATDPPTIVLVSRDKDDPQLPADSHCSGPRISGDGSAIVFSSEAANLSPDDASGRPHIYLGTPAGDPVELVSRDAAGAPLVNGGSISAAVSDDGRYVLFHTAITTGLPSPSLVRKDRDTAALDVAGVGPDIIIISFLAFDRCALSADGRSMAYTSSQDGVLITRVRDMNAAAPVTVSVHLSGTLPLFDCTKPALSADGRWVVWETPDRRMVQGDTNGYSDIFIRGPLR